MPNTVSFNEQYPVITESDKLYEKALKLIPSQTQTLAKGPQQYINGVAPKYLKRGKGSHVWDVDGNEYIDWNMGIGPLSLGYAVPEIDDAVKKQLEDGMTFSLMHPLEVEIAEMLNEIIPNAESVRYSKVGADVTSAAIRVARAYTGKNKVICCGYHGWHDWYIAVTDRNNGIPNAAQELTYTFNYNDPESVLDAIDDDTAACILEPFVFEKPKDDFLKKLRKICDDHGIVLIFDEMWTGFRVALGGAQEFFGVKADLSTYSKAVANGMPISMLVGKKDIMNVLEEKVFFYTTFGGEALSLAAAKATINFMKEHNVAEYLAKQGQRMIDGYNAIAEKLDMPYTKCTGFSCRSIVTFDASAGNPLEMKSLVQQELIKRGILWGGFHNMSYSHKDEEIEYTLKAYEEVLSILKKAVDEKNVKEQLKGEPVKPVFRKTSNFNTKPRQK